MVAVLLLKKACRRETDCITERCVLVSLIMCEVRVAGDG